MHFCLAWRTPGSWLTIFSRFFPNARGRAIVFLLLTCDLKTSLPVSFLELPALNISHWIASSLQSFVILLFLGNSGPTATLSKTTAHTMYMKETDIQCLELPGSLVLCSASAAHFLHHNYTQCLSLGQAAPDAHAPHIRNPQPRSFHLQCFQLPASTCPFFFEHTIWLMVYYAYILFFLFLLLECKLHMARTCDLRLNPQHPQLCTWEAFNIYVFNEPVKKTPSLKRYPSMAHGGHSCYEKACGLFIRGVQSHFCLREKNVFHVHHDSCRKMSAR